MNHMVENVTASDNGTHIVIKQIFVTLNPEEYVRWGDLLNMMLFYYVIWLCLTLCWNKYKKNKEEQSAPAQAIVVNDGEGVRVLNVSTE